MLEDTGISLNHMDGKEHWINEVCDRIEGLTDEQRSQLEAQLLKQLAGKQIQVFGSQNIGNQQIIFQGSENVEKIGAIAEALAKTIKEQFGEKEGAGIIKAAIVAFANILAKT